MVRVRTSGGGMGIGWSGIAEEQAAELVGRKVGELFSMPDGSNRAGEPVDLPLWDLCARLAGLPLYRLLGPRGSREVEVYDGSIYIDDLELEDAEARELYARQVQSGWDAGYRNFKIKVGRGARWMPPAEGLARDALVIRTVREAAGPDAKVLIDANMGNTLNTALQLLAETADARVYWFEEPFAEDLPLNQALKEFIIENGWDTLVADGGVSSAPVLFRPRGRRLDRRGAAGLPPVRTDLVAGGFSPARGVRRPLRSPYLGQLRRALHPRPPLPHRSRTSTSWKRSRPRCRG